jgi:hypothetical protein
LRKKLWCLPGRLGNLSLSLGNFSRSCGAHTRKVNRTHTRQQTRHNANNVKQIKYIYIYVNNGVLGVGLNTVACANRSTATTREISGHHHHHTNATLLFCGLVDN